MLRKPIKEITIEKIKDKLSNKNSSLETLRLGENNSRKRRGIMEEKTGRVLWILLRLDGINSRIKPIIG